MATINSNEIRLRLGNNQESILSEVSHTFDLSYSVMPVTTSNTGDHAEFISNLASASISFEGLMDYGEHDNSTNNLFDNSLAGQEVQIAAGTVGSSIICDGFITSFSQSGGSDESATISFTIQITGTLEVSIISTLRQLCIEGQTLCIQGQPLKVNTV